MVFSSSVFMFFFMPFVLTVYFGLLRSRGSRNLFLTLVSLVFYAWGEPWFVLVMVASILFNWFCALRIDHHKPMGTAKPWLIVALTGNLAFLCFFKYLMFIMENLNWAFGLQLPIPHIILPIGISFFTFQAMSYVIDVYRGDGKAQKNFWNVCLYIAFFPQLMAGPIVRYQAIEGEITGRRENMEDFLEGARRFLVGLGKKVILANSLALAVDHAFKFDPGQISIGASWLAAIAYLCQSYFDFSGYSDMAIGLGRMFGFHFPENFNYPMISRSITEFWRRWHISMGSWFRDYLFFPMGGSRVKSAGRLLFNMFVVWFLTGLWHGAAWNYIFWGLFFLVLLLLEKFTGFGKWIKSRPLGMLYVFVAITLNAILLRSPSMGYALGYLRGMFCAGAGGLWDSAASLILREYGAFILLGVILCFPVGSFLRNRLRIPAGAFEALSAAGLLVVLALSMSYIVMGGYNPFIYFNF
jgi:alginate O-acetyltransferase complex protein AlgI